MKIKIPSSIKKMASLICLPILIAFSSLANTVVISVSSNIFSPAATSVTVGDTVKWVFVNGNHTTTSMNIPAGATSWDSPINSSTTSFSYKVTVAGNYTYKCTPHFGAGMVGGFTANPATAINELQDRRKISFYPNPCNDFINVEFTPSKTKSTNIIISDILGNQVYRFDTEMGGTQFQKKRIDLEEIPAGIYFLSVLDDNNKQTFKILKRTE